MDQPVAFDDCTPCRAAIVEPLMIAVVLDTTELHSIPALDTGGWAELLKRCRLGQLRVMIPDVVIRESARHYGEAAVAEAKRANRWAEIIRLLGGPNPGDFEEVMTDIGDVQTFYIEGMIARCRESGVTIGPVPEIAQEEVLRRDLEGRKPFAPSGKGYRDALIWETLLQYLQDNPEVTELYFVTRNTKDYCDDDTASLADSLLGEIAGRTDGVVARLYASGQQVLNDLRVEFDEFDELADLFAPPTIDDMVVDAVEGGAARLIGESVDRTGRDAATSPFDDVVPDDFSIVTISSVVPEMSSLESFLYEEYEGDTYSLNARVDALVEFDGFIGRADYEDKSSDYTLVDPEWVDDDDDELEVRFSRRVVLGFNVLLVGTSVEDNSLDSVDLDE